MVVVGKEDRFDFNKELDTYLSSKERDEFKVKKAKPEPAPVVVEDESSELEAYDDEQGSHGVFDRLLSFFKFAPEDPEEQEEVEQLEEVYQYEYNVLDEKEEALQAEEESLEEKKQGVLKRFVESINSLFQKRDWNEADEEEVNAIEDQEDKPDEMVLHDIKTLGKITVKIMQELTPNKRKQLKESPEFSVMKEILRRYKLIK